jgi:hypothetical protein
MDEAIKPRVIWVDVGGATVHAPDVEYVQDVREAHGSGLASGMRSIVTLKSGRWIYARMTRRVIIRRVRQALGR